MTKPACRMMLGNMQVALRTVYTADLSPDAGLTRRVLDGSHLRHVGIARQPLSSVGFRGDEFIA